jgi:hypothetical protein
MLLAFGVALFLLPARYPWEQVVVVSRNDVDFRINNERCSAGSRSPIGGSSTIALGKWRD